MKYITHISKLGIALVLFVAVLAVGGITMAHAASLMISSTSLSQSTKPTPTAQATKTDTATTTQDTITTSASATPTTVATATPTILAATATTASLATATTVAEVPTATATATAATADTASTLTDTVTTASVSTSASTAATEQDVSLPSKVIISGFPLYEQEYSLSCEYAAASAITAYWGNQISEDTFVSDVPLSANPHLGFRGNINGSFGGTTNYGVYAEALVPVLEANGYNATVFYGGVSELKAEIAAGNPVQVWITSGKYIARTPVTRTYDGQTFTLVAGEHSLVVYGYDNGGVYLMDVASGTKTYTEWSSFLTRWSYFDQMALVITPN